MSGAGLVLTVIAWPFSGGWPWIVPDEPPVLLLTGLALGALGSGLAARGIWRHEREYRGTLLPVTLAAAAVLGTRSLASVLNEQQPFAGAAAAWPLLALLVALWAPVALRRRYALLGGALVIVACLCAALGLVQVTTGADPLTGRAVAMSGGSNPFVDRLYGPFAITITLAGVLALASAAAFAYALRGARLDRLGRAAAFVVAVWLFFALFRSHKRAFLPPLLVTFGVLSLTLAGRRFAALLAGSVVALAACAVAMPSTMAYFQQLGAVQIVPSVALSPAASLPADTPADGTGAPPGAHLDRPGIVTASEYERIGLWVFGAEIFQDRPWLGHGADPSAFSDALRAHAQAWWARARLTLHHAHAHCTYLQVGIEAGIVGLAAWLLFLLAIVRGLWRRVVAAQRAGRRAPAAVGALAVTAVFACASLVDDLRFTVEVYALWGWFVAIGLQPAAVGAPLRVTPAQENFPNE